MSSSAKNYAIALLACTTVGGAALVIHTRQQLAEARNAPSLQITQSEFRTTGAPAPFIASANPAATEPSENLPALETANEAAGAPTAGAGQQRGGGGAQMAAIMTELMQDADFVAAWQIDQEARIDNRYGALFKELNLPPDQLARLKTLLAERENAGRDVWATAAAQGLNPREARDQLRELTAEFQAEVDNSIRNTLGPNVLEAIGTYNSTGAQRNAVNDIAQRFTNYGQPLNDSQARQLTTILAETGTQAGRNNILISDATITRAAGVLTNAQLTQLKQTQAEQQARIIIEQKTRAAREAAGIGGGGGGGNWRNNQNRN